MDCDNTANDNRYLEHGVLDPDRFYVEERIGHVVADLERQSCHKETLFDALSDAALRLLRANPYRDPPDESELLSDLRCLWDLRNRAAFLVDQYEKAVARSRRNRAEKQASDA